MGIIYESRTKTTRPMTAEEEAQKALDEQRSAAQKAEDDANKARRQAIRDRMETWDDQLRGKTLSEILTAFQNATPTQKDDLLLYLALTRSLELK